MIRIARQLEELQPPVLERCNERYEGENKKHAFECKRRYLPFLVAEIAREHTKIMHEHYFAKHILHRHHADCVRSEVLAYLQFEI